MKISQLTAGEEVLMKIMWQLDSAYMRDIIAEYPEPKPHPNTISTFLKILVEKEFLTTRKEGRVFLYTVAVPFQHYRDYLLKNFIADYYNSRPEDLIEHMISEQMVKPDTVNDTASEINYDPQTPADAESDLSEFLREITSPKKKKKKKNKNGKKKSKKKDL